MTVPRERCSSEVFSDFFERRVALENLVTVPRKKGSSREFSDCLK